MGSLAPLLGQDATRIARTDVQWRVRAEEDDGFRSFPVPGLAADGSSGPTGMRDEIVLLSWLLVLLRIREDGQICYEWAYQRRCGGDLDPVSVRLSADDVLTGLPSQVGEVAAAVAHHIATLAPRPSPSASAPVSLLLSTSSLSSVSSGGTDQVSIPE